MNDHDRIEWLLENGGPAARLRVAADLHEGCSDREIAASVSELTGIEAVGQLLGYLDPFRSLDQPTVDKKIAHDLIHCYRETSLENFFPRLLELGFRAGMPLFDEKMQSLRAAFPKIAAVEPIYGWVICECFFKAGYAPDEMVAHMRQRLDALQHAAREQIVDIYFPEDALKGLPTQWKGKRIIKHALSPYTGATPLPTVHDIAAFAYYPPACLDAETGRKIDTLVRYILLPAFQMLPEGYGFLWYPERRTCLSSGWSPTIPYFQGFERPRNYNEWHFLNYLDMLARYPQVYSTEWFQASLNFLEQYQTEKGTYLLPQTYCHHKIFEPAFLSQNNQRLKRGEKKVLAQEIISTLFVLKIKRQAGIEG